MRLSENVPEIRDKIYMLKEIPSLPAIAQEILNVANDADIAEFSRVIEKDPGLSARLIGLANSAYFGWPGGVHTIYDAIYKVLGLKLVKSLAIGIILNKLLETRHCTAFRPMQYWFTAITTAIMAQSLFPFVSPPLKKDIENIYLNGLLHNLGIAMLVHLFPLEMSKVFSESNSHKDRSVTACVRKVLGIDQNQAGGRFARRWGLPLDIISVMEHHKELDYQQKYWPIVLLVGYCERQAVNLFLRNETINETNPLTSLGIPEAVIGVTWEKLGRQMEDIKALAGQMAKGGEYNG
jgi:HD-like signal output (HDOD) protein